MIFTQSFGERARHKSAQWTRFLVNCVKMMALIRSRLSADPERISNSSENFQSQQPSFKYCSMFTKVIHSASELFPKEMKSKAILVYFLILPALQVSRDERETHPLCIGKVFQLLRNCLLSITSLERHRTPINFARWKRHGFSNSPPSSSEAFLLAHPDASYYCAALRDKITSSA